MLSEVAEPLVLAAESTPCRTGAAVGTPVGVGIGVDVGELVAVGVEVSVGVAAVEVAVAVGVDTGVGVAVPVRVGVAVAERVAVGVGEGVAAPCGRSAIWLAIASLVDTPSEVLRLPVAPAAPNDWSRNTSDPAPPPLGEM